MWREPPFRLGATKGVFRILILKPRIEKERASYHRRDRALRATRRRRELSRSFFFSPFLVFSPLLAFRRVVRVFALFVVRRARKGSTLADRENRRCSRPFFNAPPYTGASASGECFRRSATSNNAAREIRK